jgi:ATP-dependent RNA helicase DeaD
MDQLENFKSLGLSENSINALAQKGFKQPTPVQEATIPVLMQEQCDFVGQAQTGTGKTAAFGLPIMEKLTKMSKHVQALVLTPTRELAIQVAEEMSSLKGQKKVRIAPIYGGQSMPIQLEKLHRGLDIVVGTPGRVLDHIKRKSLDLGQISFVVLDEADEMLNMGFIDEVEEILQRTNANRRTLLFSATMPKEIINIAKNYMGEYKQVVIDKDHLTTDLTEQIYYEVNQRDKFEALRRIIDLEPEFYGLIFCRTRRDVDHLSSKLAESGYAVDALHGEIPQSLREKIVEKFRKKQIQALVATDVAARGMDFQNLTHVINFSMPQHPEHYVHRIGRTGRAGKEGTAITFVTPEETKALLHIQKYARTDIRKEKIPSINNIIENKKVRIKSRIEALINNGLNENFMDIADELLQENDPQRLVAACLKLSFHKELDSSNYNEIRPIRAVPAARNGKTRLFVALGKKDAMAPKRLIKFFRETAQVQAKDIYDIQIFEDFSFINVPEAQAERILGAFKKKGKKGTKLIVERAKFKSKVKN